MNANMKVSEQCRIAASKGNKVLGMIRRNIYTIRAVDLHSDTTKIDASVCLCAKFDPISARTLSFRHQTSRKFCSHSNFPMR